MVKKIDVSTPSHPNTFALVDDEDYSYLLLGRKWYIKVRANGYREILRNKGPKGKCTSECLSRVILGVHGKAIVDHINGNRLDNRKSNLRICVQYENSSNSKLRNNRSGMKGVLKRKSNARGKPFSAAISHKGKRIHLGLFDNTRAAARAYDAAALKYHGEFARTNEMLGLLPPLDDDDPPDPA